MKMNLNTLLLNTLHNYILVTKYTAVTLYIIQYYKYNIIHSLLQ